MGIGVRITSRGSSSESHVDLLIQELLGYDEKGMELLGKVLGVFEIKGSWQFQADGSEPGGDCKAIQQVMNEKLGHRPETG
jgi:hypothetical protein